LLATSGYKINLGEDDDELLIMSKRKQGQSTLPTAAKNSGTQSNLKQHARTQKKIQEESGEELNNMARQDDDANLNHSQSVSPSQHTEAGQDLTGVNNAQQSSSVDIQDKGSPGKRLSKIEEDQIDGEEADKAQADCQHQEDGADDAIEDPLLHVDDEDTSEAEEMAENASGAKKSGKGEDKHDDGDGGEDRTSSTPDNGISSITAGLNQMSAEELRQLKELMGSSSALKIDDAEEAMPLSSNHRYDDDEDYMKKKLKGMQ